MKKIIFTIPVLLIGITLFGQTLTIKKASLDKKVLSRDGDEVLVRGIIDIEFEVKNNTKDTIYLFTRLVEPFLEEKPFQTIQTQNSIEKFDKECGGRFVYEIVSSSNYFKKLNIEEDIVRIPPNKIENMSLQRYVNEGLCPLKGKKIGLQLVYNLVMSTFSNSASLQEIKNTEEALKILENQQKIIVNDSILNKRKTLTAELKESIDYLKNDIEYLNQRIVEFYYLSKHSFTRKKLVSNIVFINE
ncbi:hypothetical protein [Flavobacterium foetidum]|uniref:hypothetical protein n=1 Tax=Flavobacterium foetidum TaxID=2026681 RepID=UPI001074FA11|nr:hypothetical protein [Flavobacterium foetidum]KAF2509099.1 hypothetical protein E0W73_19005 [Flavobacterium foetidum]